MKKYIVQKAMRFDKSYQKGEEIPENVIAKDMINKLLRCGVLAVMEVAEIKETSKITEEEQQKISLQTKEQLLQYKKEELKQMAEQKGIEVKQGMTKTDIVELLLQKE
jgi:uncharacterized protein YunC (DUF1805 family)